MLGRMMWRRWRCFSSAAASPAQLQRTKRQLPADGLTLAHFVTADSAPSLMRGEEDLAHEPHYIPSTAWQSKGAKIYLETYGCQMNVNDMEVVRAVLNEAQFEEVSEAKGADMALLMTCAIRESAETKIRNRIRILKRGETGRKLKVGILGCMAERLKTRLLEEEPLVDLVAGPDAYRDLPRLIHSLRSQGSTALNVQLSLEETYADISPVRASPNDVSAFVSIMRGCDNMCTYCIVPFTRGRERSRPIDSIVRNVKELAAEGVREVVLLGQNVNSYRDLSESSLFGDAPKGDVSTVPGFSTVYRPKKGGRRFVDLLEAVSDAVPHVRIRFTSPHPKDFPLPLLHLMAERDNLCKGIHLPAQSGDDEVLAAMGRGYSVETYLRVVEAIREVLGPQTSLTSDFIAGFCGETEEAHKKSVDLIRAVGYDFVFAFPYSMRAKTKAHRRLEDTVPEEVKKRRTDELLTAFRETAVQIHAQLVGTEQTVLVAGAAKRQPHTHFQGRIDGGTKCIIPNSFLDGEGSIQSISPGSYVRVRIHQANSQTLQGIPLHLLAPIQESPSPSLASCAA